MINRSITSPLLIIRRLIWHAALLHIIVSFYYDSLLLLLLSIRIRPLCMLSLKKSFAEHPARPEDAQAQAQAQEDTQAHAQEDTQDE